MMKSFAANTVIIITISTLWRDENLNAFEALSHPRACYSCTPDNKAWIEGDAMAMIQGLHAGDENSAR
jgi:hypothetical protein